MIILFENTLSDVTINKRDTLSTVVAKSIIYYYYFIINHLLFEFQPSVFKKDKVKEKNLF